MIPAAVVDHRAGERLNADNKEGIVLQKAEGAAFSLTGALLSLGPCRAWRRLAFRLLVKDRATPGVARALAVVARPGDRVMARHLIPSVVGQLARVPSSSCGERPRQGLPRHGARENT